MNRLETINEDFLTKVNELEDIDIEELDKSDITLQDETDSQQETVPKKGKRGRKPSVNKAERYYFSDKEENAVLDYKQYSKIIEDTLKEIVKITYGWNDEQYEKKLKEKSPSDLSRERTVYDLAREAEKVEITDHNKLYQISELKNFIETASRQNNKIFNEILKPAFSKMIESIMGRYRLFVPNESSGDTFGDTMSFLVTKMNKYDENRYKKAYSYYGNICKNYIIGKIQAYSKSLIRNPSYDDEESEIDIERYTSGKDNGKRTAKEIVSNLITQFEIMTEDPIKYDLKDTEVKLGKALVNLLQNWDYVVTTSGSNKLNKSACWFFLREQTGMDTKGVRDNMKKFQKEFLIVKNLIIS